MLARDSEAWASGNVACTADMVPFAQEGVRHCLRRGYDCARNHEYVREC